MSGDSLKPAHFWIGTTITILTIVVGVIQTNQKLNDQRSEARLAQVSNVLKDISKATSEVSGQLESQASMYLEMQSCLKKNQENESCWKGNTLFDPSESSAAWNNLDSTIAYSSPFMSEEAEIAILKELKSLKQVHQKRIRSINPPENEKQAFKLISLISKSKAELANMSENLQTLLSNRLRGAVK